jgi:hypothetical protein
MIATRRAGLRRSLMILVSALVVGAVLAPGASASRAALERDPASQVVDGTPFLPTDLGNPSADETTRERANARVVAEHRGRSHPGATSSGSGRILEERATRPATTASATTPMTRQSVAEQVVTPGMFVLNRPQGATSDASLDPTGAIIGTSMVYGGDNRIYAYPTHVNNSFLGNWTLVKFFAVPAGEYWWTSSVSASMYRGRWVAVLPTFEGPSKACAHGWLNIAVSTSGDPRKPWMRFRISIGDAWTDQINVGMSDDKVVLSTNQWDLSTAAGDCLGAPYEGARLRVLDWTDLLDGGTVTSRDVTPATATSYWNWVPATNIPGTAATTTGATVQLAGDKNVGGWGHVVHATITGSAKAATAKVAANEDLTALGTVPQLVGPPATIAALPSGNGFQDERVVSAVYRGGRLWLTSTTSCRLAEDPDFRACARFIELNTTTVPASVVDDASFTAVGRDTFLPVAGFSRDGTSYLVMSASSATAHEPIDEYATWRAPGVVIAGGEDEQKIWSGDLTYEDPYFGDRAAVIAEPGDSRGVWAVYPASTNGWSFSNVETHLIGGLSGTPDGSFKISTDTGWINYQVCYLVLSPATTSPIQAVRWSVSPDVEDTAGGPHLVHGRDSRSLGVVWNIDLADPVLGGTPAPTSATVYVQWQTQDGSWSTPVSRTATIESTPPTVSTPSLAFAGGTVGTTVPVRVSWTASDTPSGLRTVQLFLMRSLPSILQSVQDLPPATTTIIKPLTLGGRYSIEVQGIDLAENSSVGVAPTATFSAIQNSSTSVKYGGTWTTSSSSSYLGGSTRYATKAGAYASYTFTGRGIAFVTTKGPTRGKVEVWIDGVRKTTLNLYTSGTHYRQLVYQTSWPTAGTHTIRIRVLGTSGRPRVDFDAYTKF